jgi:hypothetical protein
MAIANDAMRWMAWETIEIWTATPSMFSSMVDNPGRERPVFLVYSSR